MIARTFRGMMQILGGLGAGLAIVMILAAWRLSSGPISLAFLNTYLEGVLSNAHPEISVQLDDTILTWAGWERTLDIRVVNLRAMNAKDAVVAKVPQMSIAFSARGLSKGVAAPKSIEIFNPRVRLVRLKDGGFEVGMGGEDDDANPSVTEVALAFLENWDPDSPMRFLTRLSIVDGDLTIEDRRQNAVWRAPKAQVKLRRHALGVRGEISLDLETGADPGDMAFVTVLGDYRKGEHKVDLGIAFSELAPSVLSRIDPAFDIMAGVKIPLRGTMTASVSADQGVETLGFEISGQGGELSLPEPIKQNISLQDMVMIGRYEGETGILQLIELVANLGPEGTVHIPGPNGHDMPVERIRADGHYFSKEARVAIDNLDLDLHGPKAHISATIDGVGGPLDVKASGELEGMRVDELARYWPQDWGAEAHGWCVAHLSDGAVPKASIDIHLGTGEEGQVELKTLSGKMDIFDVTVDYLAPMPKARHAMGRAEFDMDSFDIWIDSGEVQGLSVDRGTIWLTGLDQYDQFADIKLTISGPVQNALELIDSEPLGFASALGIKPSSTDGAATTDLDLYFILENDLTLEQVKVSASSELRRVRIADVMFGKDVSGGDLRLRVDKKAMNVIGRAKVGDVPAVLAWQENFGKGAPFRSKYEVRGRLDDVSSMADFGLDPRPVVGDALSGPLSVNLIQEVRSEKKSILKVSLDAIDMSADVPNLGWRKDPGQPGTAEMEVHFDDGSIVAIPSFAISGAGLRAMGNATWSKGALERVILERFILGRNDVNGVLMPSGEGRWNAVLKGGSLDLSAAWKGVTGNKGQSDEPETAPVSQEGPLFDVSIALNRVWMDEKQGFDNVAGRLVRQGDTWKTLDLKGSVKGKKALELKIEPKANRKRALLIRGGDAGEALRVLGLFDNMVEGKLVVTGEIDDAKPGNPVAGIVQIKKFRIKKAPVLAHVLSLAALTGIVESLQGEGLHFQEMKLPYVMNSGDLSLKEAKAWGPSLGFTAEGRYDTIKDAFDMEGTIVPAYAINAVLGQIPLIGEVFTGEKGSGVFAATYTVTGTSDDPNVSVNPLTALAPGFLRNLFDVFDEDKKPKDGKGAPAKPKSPAKKDGKLGTRGQETARLAQPGLAIPNGTD